MRNTKSLSQSSQNVMAAWTAQCSSICDAPVEALAPEDLQADHPAADFRDLWNELDKGRRLPDRSRLTITKFKSVMRWLLIFEQETAGDTFEYLVRLCGSSTEMLTHHNVTGQYLHEFTSEACYDSRYGVLTAAIETAGPLYARIKVENPETAEFKEDILAGFFPFETSDGKSQVVTCVAPAEKSSRSFLSAF